MKYSSLPFGMTHVRLHLTWSPWTILSKPQSAAGVVVPGRDAHLYGLN